jgi:hypothetical protein
VLVERHESALGRWRLLASHGGVGIAELAGRAGFNRDLRAFAGASPRDHLARRLPDGGAVTDGWAGAADPPSGVLRRPRTLNGLVASR